MDNDQFVFGFIGFGALEASGFNEDLVSAVEGA